MMIKNEKGSVIIEVALMMPLLFMIMFGYISMNQMVYESAVIQTAAREGARDYAVYHDPEQAIGVARRELGSSMSGATIETIEREPEDRGMRVERPFTVRIPFGEVKVYSIKREVILHQVPEFEEGIYD